MDLVKALRAMQHTPDWTQAVEAACLFTGKPYGPEVLQDMTRMFLDDLDYDPATLVVTVPVSVGSALLDAVQEWHPTPTVEAVDVDAPLIADRLEAIETTLASLTNTLAVTPEALTIN